MAQILLLACCFLGCPLIVGGMMLGIGRDHSARGLEREVRRLNAAAPRELPGLAADRTPSTSPQFRRLQTAFSEDVLPSGTTGT